MRHFAAPFMALSLLITACNQGATESPGVTAVPTSTPQEQVVKCFTAMAKMDEKTVLACFDANEKQEELLKVIIQGGRIYHRFKDKFIKTYGEQGWLDFQDPAKAPREADTKLFYVEEKDLPDIKAIEVTIKKGLAEFMLPGTERKGQAVMTSHHDKQGWLLSMTCYAPKATDFDAILKAMKSWNATVEKFIKAIGHKKITAEDIDVELSRYEIRFAGTRLNKARLRFDIDEIP